MPTLSPTRALAAAPLLVGALLAACGARTGLRVPDEAAPGLDAQTPAPDARVDARADAARTDAAPFRCRTAADCDDGVACTQERCNSQFGTCFHIPLDSACSDGIFCNGVERCVAGQGCVTTPTVCEDGVACTRDRCDEAAAMCVQAPDDTLCPISHRCDAHAGCIARALAHGPTGLYEVQLPSGTVLRLAGLPRGLTDIALHPDRTLYGIGSAGLYRIDATTGATVLIAPLDLPFTALDAAPDGTLYAGAGREIYRMDPTLGRATLVAEFPPGLEASGDLAFFQGRLLATARVDAASPDTLVEFELSTGIVQSIGPIGSQCVWGLAAFGATLYGLTCNGEVLSIDPASGHGTVLTRGATLFYGATAR